MARVTVTTKGTTATVKTLGAQGPRGTVWRSGSGAPADSLGVDRDVYLDTDTGDLYERASGTYSVVDNIIGPKGDQGDTGPQGDKGWSPTFAVVSDGARRVLQVNDWVGGEGTKPATGDYVGSSGLVSAIADAVDIRGPDGPTDPTALDQSGASNLDGIVWSDSAGAWEVGPSVAAKLLAKEVRQGKEPVLLHDFANDAHHTINPTDATGLELDLSRIWTFSRSSTVNGWTLDANGDPVLTEFASGAPAFVIDPATGQRLGYRALAGFTNSLLWNRDLSNAVWRGSAAIAQDAVGLDGVANTAHTITDNNASDFDDVFQRLTVNDDTSIHTVTFPIGKTDTAVTFPEVSMKFKNGTTSLDHDYIVNTDDGTLILRSGADAADEVSIDDWGSFWVITITSANNGTGNTRLEWYIFPAVNADASDTIDSTVTGSCVYDFGGVYLNSEAGPPIETEGSPVSTAADDASEPLPASCQDGFVWVGRLKTPTSVGTSGYIFFVSDGSQNNRAFVDFAESGEVRFGATEAGSNIVNFVTVATVSFDTTVRIAARFEDGNYAISVNGGAVTKETSTGFPLNLSTRFYGNRDGTFYLNSTIALDELHSDPENWTDADLQNASAL